jgi:hypothetical protein
VAFPLQAFVVGLEDVQSAFVPLLPGDMDAAKKAAKIPGAILTRIKK